MQMMKVYNAKCRVIESISRRGVLHKFKTLEDFIANLNARGLYVRRQLSKSGKTVMRSIR